MMPRSTCALILLVAVVARRDVGAAEPAEVDLPIDCGPAALFAPGTVVGRPIDYDKLAARLPRRQGGHSMRELRDAARSFGLAPEGLYVGEDARLIDRPMLAFVKDKAAKIEHFLVVRPVGHTGSLVQLIDSNGPPRVIDKVDLVASAQWTGVVLTPTRTNWTVVGGSGLLAAAGLMGLGRWMARRGRRRAIIDP